MENLVSALEQFRGRRVLITGDTGFKGSWLSLWLQLHGAEVFGYALPAEENSHFEKLRLESLIQHENGDIRDFEHLSKFVSNTQPEIIFHLAAQALVMQSYQDPRETFETNVGGSTNVLEVTRRDPNIKALVYITSDKCYLNKEVTRGYIESDELGGHDPYSASKAAAELVFASYAKSFFSTRAKFGAASARAGNVIGGGDWSDNRIIPDCVRALMANRPIEIRKPLATRPWQHVLEPLSGYLSLAEQLYTQGQAFAESWNFGPNDDDARAVQWIVEHMVQIWGNGASWQQDGGIHPHEANYLKLDISKAKSRLGWQPRWPLGTALEHIGTWHQAWLAHEDMQQLCFGQIQQYSLTQNSASL